MLYCAHFKSNLQACWRMIMIAEPLNIWYDFSANPAATSQCSYNTLAILYLLCISERILYLIDDITIILHVADTRLSKCYNVATGSWFLGKPCTGSHLLVSVPYPLYFRSICRRSKNRCKVTYKGSGVFRSSGCRSQARDPKRAPVRVLRDDYITILLATPCHPRQKITLACFSLGIRVVLGSPQVQRYWINGNCCERWCVKWCATGGSCTTTLSLYWLQ